MELMKDGDTMKLINHYFRKVEKHKARIVETFIRLGVLMIVIAGLYGTLYFLGWVTGK